MKNCFLLISMFIAMTVASLAQYTVNIKINNSDGEIQDNLIVGVHPDATDYIDEEPPLNEYEHPGSARGDMLHFFFSVPDKHIEGAQTFTYIDYKKEEETSRFRREYLLRGQFGASTITLSWNIPDNQRLDSAYMVDALTGDLFFVDMLEKEELQLDNDAWDMMKIVLVFKASSSVNEKTEEPIALYPNPTNDYVKINIDNIQSYKIFDSTGREVLNGEYNGEQIDVAALEKGFYNIVLIDYNAKIQSKKFIKI